MRTSWLVVLAACGTASSPPAAPDATAPGADAPAADALTPAPWGERCGNATDDDNDGIVDEDCAPSLFAGVFAPSGAGDPALAAIEAITTRPLDVIQTYHSLSALGIARTGPDLTSIFARGQVAHLNIEPNGYTAIDDALAAMATTIADALATDPHGRVLLTFGAEMNGDWTDWSCLPPAQYIALYRAAHTAISSALVARAIDTRRTRWVYGPNATSSSHCGSAAAYYPGHAYVDLLGMSAYRPDGATVDASVIAPMSALFDALSYPAAWRHDRFVVLQTGARLATDRAAWISSLFATAEADERIAGIIYFDAADWAAPPTTLAPPIAAAPLADASLDGVFVPHFWDVPFDHPAFPEIQALRDADITSGCATAPPRFCPDDPIHATDAITLLRRAFPGATVTLADPVREQDLATTISALGGVPPATDNSIATRARAAIIVTHGANVRPMPL